MHEVRTIKLDQGVKNGSHDEIEKLARKASVVRQP